MHPFRFTPLFAMRMHLRRRLFFSLAAAIIVTAAFMGVVSHTFGGGWDWKRDHERLRTFVSHEFTGVWEDPPRRSALASGMARDLGVDLTLLDASGTPLQILGPPCTRPDLDATIQPSPGVAGRVLVCAPSLHPPLRRALLPLAAGILVLWAVAGAIARRLARPITEVVRVAEAIGRGDLTARIPVRRRRGYSEATILAVTLNEMAERIQAQLDDQRALLAAVSHEIRTPLARMRLLVEFARGGSLAKLDSLDQEIVGVDALVSDLLASSRLDFKSLSRRDLDAEEVARRALEEAGLPAEGILDAPSDRVPFAGDPTLVVRALVNLLENAKRHAAGVTRLSVGERAGRVIFTVEDDGPGLPPGDEARIFEAFFKKAATKEAERASTGLGLALVKRIADAHGGGVFAENRGGSERGARVGVSFPT